MGMYHLIKVLSNLNRYSKCQFTSFLCRRQFFSQELYCEEVWKSRLTTPVLKNCKLEDFYYSLENCHSSVGTINSIDLDVFVNAVPEGEYLEEIQDLVHKHRLSAEAANILQSTQHAFIRHFLQAKEYEELLRILNDRLNYGIFPDDYSVLLLLDTFIKKKNYKNAAKVATMQMLQEDFENPLILYLSLYSCHQHLLDPVDWEEPEQKEDEDDEEVKVRVKYLRNPYFDEHFDLKAQNDLIGKTFVMIGDKLNNDLGASYKLLGLILFNKLVPAKELVELILSNKKRVNKDILELCEKVLKELVTKNEGNDEKNSNLNDLIKLIAQMKSEGCILEEDSLSVVENEIKSLTAKLESEVISNQITIYQQWIDKRDELLQKALKKVQTEKRLKDVEEAKRKLKKREEELFFFDKEDELELRIEKKVESE